MSTVRGGDHIMVGKIKRGTFFAVHLEQGIEREIDDCNMFLFDSAWLSNDDTSNALIAARRLLAELAPGQFRVRKKGFWWDRGWRLFPVYEV